MTYEPDQAERIDLHERIAKIEAKVEHIDAIASARAGNFQRLEAKLDSLEKDLERYRGTVGGVLLVFTALITFFKLFWDDMLRYFK